MKLNTQALALSLGIIGVTIFGLCILWGYSFPNMMGGGMHTEMMKMWSPGFTGFSFGGVVWGAILSFGFGWIIGWALGSLYNRFNK